MDSGSYSACAGLVARTQQLELVAQDLANASTSGYRTQQTRFKSVLAGAGGPPLSAWSSELNGFGVLGSTSTSRNPGNLESTGNPLDLGMEGDGFFVVQTPAGMRYTRNGQFTVSPSGNLVTRDGYPVLGDQGPILMPAGEVSVSRDGTLSVEGALAGKLRLVQFSPSIPLQAEGATYFAAPPNSAAPALNFSVRQGMLESSNVNPVAAAVQLVALQRTAQMLQHALSMFHSEFDRIAAEELPKV